MGSRAHHHDQHHCLDKQHAHEFCQVTNQQQHRDQPHQCNRKHRCAHAIDVVDDGGDEEGDDEIEDEEEERKGPAAPVVVVVE